MSQRNVAKVIQTREVTEGAGVTVHRSIGTPALRNLDPFLMLDHFGSNDPNQYIAGFPDHPHRGFITFTYMLEGHMLHQDSMGNKGDLTSGAAQWMKAASGVIHSEMPQQEQGMMSGFQLWINLPANQKMSEPAYQEFSASAFPVVEQDGQLIKILSGEYAGLKGPINDPNTNVGYCDVTLDSAKTFHYVIPQNDTAFVYVFEGELTISGQDISTHSFVVLSAGDEIEVHARGQGARFILVHGKPIGEPIVQYGPFVMNTRDEIDQAMIDYRDGRLVQQKAEMIHD